MSDMMTREEAIKIIDCYDLNFYDLSGEKIPADKLAEAFDMAIEALSAEAVHGEWKHTITWQPYCSNCEYVFGEDEEFSPFWNYCPHCGAKMEGGE